MARGFFAIGVYHPKSEVNVGTLWRAATLYDAAFVFTIGERYRRQASDTPNSPKHMPLFQFTNLDDLVEHLPFSCPLVGVELDPRATMLGDYRHFERSCYLLGAEDHGLPPGVIDRCHAVVQIETPNPQSMNVAAAGSILLRDRYVKALAARPLAVSA